MPLEDGGVHRRNPAEPCLRRLPAGGLNAELNPLLVGKVHRFERFEYPTAVNSFDLAQGKALKLLG